MSLKEEVSNTLTNFESVPVDQIINNLEKIKTTFQSNITKEYLNGKLAAIKNSSEDKKKSLCKNLIPYFNWYLEKS